MPLSVLSILVLCLSPSVLQVTSQDVVFAVGSLGMIGGSSQSTRGNSPKNYTQFIGIPYAHLPLRFQPSVVKEDRLTDQPIEVFNATAFGSECPQPNPTDGGTEDCLFLNVFTPEVTRGPHTNLRPVIVFIHGAAFVSGNANPYTGARLLNRDVVLVSFNYRLGVFGHLSLNIPEAPGNAALYDAVSCLQWVQKFIHHFGGDPTRVTLAGQSSGSATVSHLLFSSHTSGLFHRAIAASGSALEIWATAYKPVEAALTVASYVNCHVPGTLPNISAVLSCLHSKNQSDLMTAQNTFQEEARRTGDVGFTAVTPSIQLPLTTALITSFPEAVLESSQQQNVPLMMSATREDGGFALRLILEGYLIPNGVDDDPDFLRHKLIPLILSSYGVNDMNHAIANALEKRYFPEDVLASGNFSQMVPSLIDMLGALSFKSGSHRTVDLHGSLNNQTYFYSFEYAGQFTRHPTSVPFPGGVAHADDLIYLFPLTQDLNPQDRRISEIMVDFWANFATTGNPNEGDSLSVSLPQWTAVHNSPNNDVLSYLRIHNEETKSLTDYPGSWVIANKPSTPTECTRSSSTFPKASQLMLTVLSLLTMHVLIK